MAKNPAQKLKKKRQVKKPQKLPISVQALLKYLGGTNVAVGGGGSRQAVIAPQFPMPQQQQAPVPPLQAPSQPAAPRRRRNVGTVIASSPLAQLAPPPPLPQQVQPRQPDEKLIAKETVKRQAKEQERKLASERVEKLEGQLGSFTEKANIVVRNIRSLEKTVRQRFSNDDEDLLDNEIPADARPFLDEPLLNVALTKAPAIARSSSVPIMRTSIELDPEQGAAAAQQYITNVSRPEMTKEVKLKGKPGRKPLTEAEREARKVAKKSAGESFLAEGASIASSVEALTASLAPRGKTPKTPRAKSGAALQKLQGLDPSTQIQALSAQSQGGGAAKRGISIIDLLKSTAKPQ